MILFVPMELKTYIKQLPKEERDPFAKRCGTSMGFLRLIAYKTKRCSPELAVEIDRESNGLVPYKELCPAPKFDWEYVERKAVREHFGPMTVL